MVLIVLCCTFDSNQSSEEKYRLCGHFTQQTGAADKEVTGLGGETFSNKQKEKNSGEKKML